jgi:hypothetical protein
MTQRDDQLAEGFLVDGVAPSVIGGEESPEPPADDYEEFRPQARREDFQPGTRTEPPTTPIPALNPNGQPRTYSDYRQQDERKGWLGRMFGR